MHGIIVYESAFATELSIVDKNIENKKKTWKRSSFNFLV